MNRKKSYNHSRDSHNHSAHKAFSILKLLFHTKKNKNWFFCCCCSSFARRLLARLCCLEANHTLQNTKCTPQMKTIHICTHIMWWIGSVVNMVRMYVSRSNMYSAKRCNMHLISYGHIFCTLHRECRNSETITLHSTVHFTPIEENKLDKQSEFDDGVFFLLASTYKMLPPCLLCFLEM